MADPSPIPPAVSTLWDTFSSEVLKTELDARRGRTEALQHRPPGLEQVEMDLLLQAVLDDPRVIYNHDDRQDVYQIQDNNIIRLVQSTVLIVGANELAQRPDGNYQLITTTLRARFNLCNGQRFENQPSAGFCTGFFVTHGCIATAGHCIEGQNVQNLRFITGFQMDNAADATTIFRPDQIFEGVQPIRLQYTQNSASEPDYALVEVKCLNARVVGTPLQISPLLKVNDGENIFVIGHPSGLPTKYAPNSTVQDNTPQSYFVANLDVFGGNSGSPVIDANTNLVVGILTRGAPDYIGPPRGCQTVYTCPNPGCTGEYVQRITGVMGPIHDLAIELQIGNNGMYTGRTVEISFRGDARSIILPATNFDAHKSYRFPLDPQQMHVQMIDDITIVDIYSPATQAPIFTDEWDLKQVIVRVNGGQALYTLRADHTFQDALGSNTLTWQRRLTPLPN